MSYSYHLNDGVSYMFAFTALV